MRLCISNIAWRREEEPAVAELLRWEGVRHVEIAPTRIADDPATLTPAMLERYRNWWADHGVSIVAMQALLFGRPDLVIFGEAAARNATVAYLRIIIEIAASLGAETLVFGSPRNRLTNGLPATEVEQIEKEFFSAVGAHAAAHGVTFCVEANPSVYGCDYLQTIAEVRAMLRRVGSPGLGVHIDSGAMEINGESIETLDGLNAGSIRHVHVSEPSLQPVGSSGAAIHRALGSFLRRQQYDRYVSIEMRGADDRMENQRLLQQAIRFVRDEYIGA
jgi:D-psicose/D-tagatose/L-ribulose 3-epimerase